jgi:hypothetical protein
MTGSNNDTETKNAQLIIGQQSSIFSVTTDNENDPDQFVFTPIVDAQINQLYTSNIIILT